MHQFLFRGDAWFFGDFLLLFFSLSWACDLFPTFSFSADWVARMHVQSPPEEQLRRNQRRAVGAVGGELHQHSLVETAPQGRPWDPCQPWQLKLARAYDLRPQPVHSLQGPGASSLPVLPQQELFAVSTGSSHGERDFVRVFVCVRFFASAPPV